MPDTKKLLLLFSGCHLAAMSSVITNPIMYGMLNGNFKQVYALCLARFLTIHSGYPVNLLSTEKVKTQ